MRPRSWWAIGAGAYVAFAVATLPAGTVYRWLAPSSIELGGLGGTIWSGQAANGNIAGVPLHDLHWQLDPWALLIARVAGDFEGRLIEGFASAHLRATLGSIDLSEVRASTNLGSLGSALPAAAAGATGLASLSLQSLRIVDAWPVDADGELRLSDLAVPPLLATRTNSLVPLGGYRVLFSSSSGAGIEAMVTDTGGPVEVSGSLRLAPDHTYELRALARPRPDADPMLVQGLQLMGGQPDAAGRREFSLSGSL